MKAVAQPRTAENIQELKEALASKNGREMYDALAGGCGQYETEAIYANGRDTEWMSQHILEILNGIRSQRRGCNQ